MDRLEIVCCHLDEASIRAGDRIDYWEELERDGASCLYSTPTFHQLHYQFTERLVLVLFVDTNTRPLALLVGGISNGQLRFPYSAPFARIEFEADTTLETRQACYRQLPAIARFLGADCMQITLPPASYFDNDESVVYSALLNAGLQVTYCDTSNRLDLARFATREKFLAEAHHSVRKNFKKANRAGLSFCRLQAGEFLRAYDVVAINRRERELSLRIAREQMQRIFAGLTSFVDCFLVRSGERDVAAAIVYRVTARIRQVIYWGSLSEFNAAGCMAMLVAGLFETYRDDGETQLLDIGPSSEHGEVNFPLLQFKLRNNCASEPKYSFSWVAES